MINGIHTLIYSADAEKDRAFFRDTLGLKFVDSGGGWLIYALPPAELGVHPAEGDDTSHELYLMCDSIESTIAELRAKGVECTDVMDAGWGLLTTLTLPSGGKLGMYEPRHEKAIGL